MPRLRLALAAPLLVVACSRSAPPARTADSVPVAPAARAARTFPAVGVAVMDTARRWCAAFPDSAPVLPLGTRVTIVFVEHKDVSALNATAHRTRDVPCPTAFAQPRWTDYRAYDLELVDSLRLDTEDVPLATLAVAGEAPWSRGADGVVRADLDLDGVVEEARVCRADEGQHFTLWSGSGDMRRRRAHEYFDWGALVDPTCAVEEIEEGAGPDDS